MGQGVVLITYLEVKEKVELYFNPSQCLHDLFYGDHHNFVHNYLIITVYGYVLRTV